MERASNEPDCRPYLDWIAYCIQPIWKRFLKTANVKAHPPFSPAYAVTSHIPVAGQNSRQPIAICIGSRLHSNAGIAAAERLAQPPCDALPPGGRDKRLCLPSAARLSSVIALRRLAENNPRILMLFAKWGGDFTTVPPRPVRSLGCRLVRRFHSAHHYLLYWMSSCLFARSLASRSAELMSLPPRTSVSALASSARTIES